MNIVDFSNATITVATTAPVSATYLGLDVSATLCDSSGTSIVSNQGKSRMSMGAEGFVEAYYGRFTASGSSFYIGSSSSALYWQVSGVSFASGDFYCFAVPVIVPVEESD